MLIYSQLHKGDTLQIIGLGFPGFAKAGDKVTVAKTYINKVLVKDKNGSPYYITGSVGQERFKKITSNKNIK